MYEESNYVWSTLHGSYLPLSSFFNVIRLSCAREQQWQNSRLFQHKTMASQPLASGITAKLSHNHLVLAASLLGNSSSRLTHRQSRASCASLQYKLLLICILSSIFLSSLTGTESAPFHPKMATSPSESAKALDKRRLSWSGSRKINTYEQDELDASTTTTDSGSSSSTKLPQDQLQDKQAFLSSLLAGVGSGSLASVVCAPLDLVRTRMQVIGGLNNNSNSNNNPRIVQSIHQIYKSDGIRGCFRGLGVTLATVPAFWGLYFPLYEKLKSHLLECTQPYGDNGPNHHALIHLTSAISAGAVADILCNPMFVIRTRMQTEALHYFQMPEGDRKPHSILQTVRGLYKEGGVPMFWRGLTASLLGLGHVGIQFPLYERFKAEARRRSVDGEESPLDLLLASGLSKMMAAMITYPHEVVRSRMMDARGDAVRGVFGTLRHIVRTEGYSGLYVGLRVSLVRVVPNCCVTFVSYELIARWVRGNMMMNNAMAAADEEENRVNGRERI
jgi:solute carrier family 25 folate transporter 32